jgi:hypothetical protein
VMLVSGWTGRHKTLAKEGKLLTKKTAVAAKASFHTVLASFMPLVLIACGSPANPPASALPAIAAKPDVIVTFDGERHSCVVALLSEAQGSIIPCNRSIYPRRA